MSMNVIFRDGAAYVSGVAFDAELTLMESAQTFHWIRHDGAYYGAVIGRPVRLDAWEGGVRLFPCAPEDFSHFERYFDWTRNYADIGREYASFPLAKRAMDMLGGLRVLNQSAWDALVMFILSSNNNTSRIRKLTLSFAERFGERYELEGVAFYAVPSALALLEAGEDALRALGCGYRAPYLIGTARAVCEGFPLGALGDMAYEEAHMRLVELPGVGDKVADCVLLFGCGHASAFPVDVWVERLLLKWFPDVFAGKKMSRAAMGARARALLGEHAGLIQQYLFHCARCGLISLDDMG